MQTLVPARGSAVANAVYSVLDPIPFGCFVAALVFDIAYARTAEILWTKAAAWLIVIGLLAAVLPRLIQLARVWITGRRVATRADRLAFWLDAAAIVAAIFNAFVHGRDAYAVVPAGPWLSLLTVALLVAARLVSTTSAARTGADA